MTLSIDGTDIGQIVEIASLVGSIVAMLLIGLLVYLMVRPPRHVRERRRHEALRETRRPEADPEEAEDMRLLADRMEMRIEVLERLLADQIERSERPTIGCSEPQQDFAPAEDGRDTGRKE